jgi:hypothetical protein
LSVIEDGYVCGNERWYTTDLRRERNDHNNNWFKGHSCFLSSYFILIFNSTKRQLLDLLVRLFSSESISFNWYAWRKQANNRTSNISLLFINNRIYFSLLSLGFISLI